MDGFEVAHRLRLQDLHPRPLIAAVTGYGSAEDRERGMQAAFHAYLVKPMGREAIREVLAQAGERAA